MLVPLLAMSKIFKFYIKLFFYIACFIGLCIMSDVVVSCLKFLCKALNCVYNHCIKLCMFTVASYGS